MHELQITPSAQQDSEMSSMGHRQGKRREQGEQAGTDVNSVLDQVFFGKQEIISHDGVSQYQKRRSPSAGRSACGLAALNCARLIFGKEDGGLAGEELIRWLLSRRVAEEITSICDYWTKASHLEMEDILDVPIFSENLSLVKAPTYSSQNDLAGFKALLQDMENASKSSSSAVMITKPPEIVACVKIPTSRGNIFLIFDSHIRPNHPLGAGFILNSTVESTATYLVKLFKSEKPSSSDVGNPFQWQLDLVRQFCGHILVSKRSSDNDTTVLTQTVLESSMKILELTAEMANLKIENSFLAKELEKTNQKLSEMKAPRKRDEAPRTKGTHGRSSLVRGWRKDKSSPDAIASNSSRMFDAQRQDDRDRMLALQLQEEFAREEQLRYEEEDQRLSVEREALVMAQQALFKCGVCLEELPEYNVVRLLQCLHSFCRDCMTEYVRSKLSEQRFPILCPVCVVEKPSSEPGVVEDSLIKQIGITESEYRVFEDLQMSIFSVLLHCRRCRDSMFVDRQEHQEAKVLVCPLPGSFVRRLFGTAGPNGKADSEPLQVVRLLFKKNPAATIWL
ncbi:hypothetical protein D9615_000203 [Tricholomella constricta]|uniref:RING-type domain-containing protein n=1 Tax=Tricholomella constricta TaxID=117010 RepID=A0A8H5MBS0_9AGAR|nr:hypothetical protein D9615_000203 [Tricholomella constricta]